MRAANALLLAALVGAFAASQIPPGRSAVAAVRAARPGPCTTQVAAEPRLAQVRRTMVKVPGAPFGVAAGTGGGVFVSGYGSEGGYVAVMSDQGFAPRLVRVVSLPVLMAAGL